MTVLTQANAGIARTDPDARETESLVARGVRRIDAMALLDTHHQRHSATTHPQTPPSPKLDAYFLGPFTRDETDWRARKEGYAQPQQTRGRLAQQMQGRQGLRNPPSLPLGFAPADAIVRRCASHTTAQDRTGCQECPLAKVKSRVSIDLLESENLPSGGRWLGNASRAMLEGKGPCKN